MKLLFVAGSWGDNYRNSRYCDQLNEILRKHFDVTMFNGGTFEHLESLLPQVRNYDIVLWFANVANDKPKLVEKIKIINPRCLLVISKRNFDGKYEVAELVSRMLKVKANLLLEFTDSGMFAASLLDPLGNVFLDHNTYISDVGFALATRLIVLSSFTRIGSVQVGPSKPIPSLVPFNTIVKHYGDKFAEALDIETNRYLGNASFRCRHGFPSFRLGNGVYVSRRNVDKQNMSPEDFVAVENRQGIVGYYGPHKPSVDTPIQLVLYSFYGKINFMVHGHAYIEGAPFTSSVIPCGAYEEVHEIQEVYPDRDIESFAINLKGHGCLIAGEHWKDLENVPIIPRPLPEIA